MVSDGILLSYDQSPVSDENAGSHAGGGIRPVSEFIASAGDSCAAAAYYRGAGVYGAFLSGKRSGADSQTGYGNIGGAGAAGGEIRHAGAGSVYRLRLHHYQSCEALSRALGTASDISPEALQTARENARRLEAEVTFIESDLFERIHGSFDLIVSNPPYIPTGTIDRLMAEVRFHDPRLALDGREDGLYFYRKIIKDSDLHLKQGGWLMFEIGSDQAEAVSGLMRQAQFTRVRVIRDLAGLDRVVIGRRS